MTTPTGEIRKFRHPGAGKRKTRPTAKGRQVEPAALREIAGLLGDRPRRRDLLIEHLHLIQDRWHHISARHLQALAELMRIPMAEAYEVATFYHHFDVVKEGEEVPAALTVRVCESLSCDIAGARELREWYRGIKDIAVGTGCAWDKCLFDQDFWKVREIGARYNLPQSLIGRTGASRASLAFSARNLFTIWQAQKRIYDQVITDPEFGNPSGGSNVRGQPPSVNLNVTLRVTF